MASPTKCTMDTNINLGQQHATLGASQNDYTALAGFGCLGISASSSGFHVTGLTSGAAGRLGAIIHDPAGSTFTLDDESASSEATNRMKLAGVNITFGTVRKGMMLMYDDGSQRWYKVS